MILWIEWYRCVSQLRPACSRSATFVWLVLALVGISIRTESLGVTSIVRSLGLQERCYFRLLHLFHSKALKLDALTTCWIKLAMVLFTPLKVGKYIILVVDGLKISKEGRKMPAVKKLHQESQDNSKPEFIWGHSFQVVGILVDGILGTVFAVPLISRIHEGVVFSNRDKKTLMDKMVNMLFSVTTVIKQSIILVADSYYANKKVMKALIKKGEHLISRIRSNAVAYYPAKKDKKKGPGAKKKYGVKVTLMDFFVNTKLFATADSPIYGETNVSISYYCINLMWRPIGQLVRFVLVDHPSRGKIILVSTDISLEPLQVIAIYGYRFKIEVSFKQAVHVLGTYAYHFWMKAMTPIKRISGNQYLHKKSSNYREQVKRKINAYHCFVQIGCIAQGLLLHLSINFRSQVWDSFRSWFRTMKKDMNPSELVVAYALRASLPEFFEGSTKHHALKKFITENTDPSLLPDWELGTIVRT